LKPSPLANPVARWGESIRSGPIATALTAGMIALLVAGLLWPIAMAIYQAFIHRGAVSGYWFTRLLHDRTVAQLINGLKLASLATGISLLLAVPLALVRARCRFLGQRFLGVAVLVPLILPPFVGAMSMRQLLGQFGAVNLILQRLGLLEIGPGELPPDWLAGGMVGVAIIQALHLFPILYLNASASLANIDPSYTQAARNLGAGPARTFFRVTLPLMRPGLFAGGTIVFIWSFTDIGTPLIMNYTDLLPVRIFQELSSTYGGKTFAMVFVLLVISVGLYVLGKFVFGRSEDVAGSKATLQAETHKLGPAGTAAAWGLFGLVILLAILPHIGVVLSALAESWINTILPTEYTTAHLEAVVTSEETYTSILNSLKYAGVSTVIDLGLGTLAAWLIVRSRTAGSALLDALAMLPLAVPGLILAAGYVAMTVPGTWLDRMGITPVDNPFALLVIAYAVRRLPFVVRGVSAGLQQVPVSLEEAARNLGSSRAGAARRITLPLVTANLVAAGVLTFAFAMLEVSDSLVLAQRSSDFPITKQIYILYTSGTAASMNVAASLGVYGMGLLAATMAIASILLGRKLGAIFRA
jgi:iron(III) transport system permease protein